MRDLRELQSVDFFILVTKMVSSGCWENTAQTLCASVWHSVSHKQSTQGCLHLVTNAHLHALVLVPLIKGQVASLESGLSLPMVLSTWISSCKEERQILKAK